MTLEERVEELDNGMKDILKVLGEMNEQLKTINSGLYGDIKNRTVGVIQKQEDLEKRMYAMECDFKAEKEANIRINIAQDNLLKGRTGTIDDGVKWGMRILLGVGVLIEVVYLITGKISLIEIFKH